MLRTWTHLSLREKVAIVSELREGAPINEIIEKFLVSPGSLQPKLTRLRKAGILKSRHAHGTAAIERAEFAAIQEALNNGNGSRRTK